ncbi:MAG: YegS/Rv2252/BmrU family lipid kinase [Balneola sp.]|nr:MAG: YegS/Rv2252/BmrU family lipid kinase [Balneola sp.]
MNYFLLVNTFSNSGKSKAVIQNHFQLIKKYLPNSEIRFLEEGDRIEEIVSGIEEGFDVCVACGGDGTISAVASAIRNRSLLLGVLPIGTGNDFAKSLGLKKSLEENLAVLKKAEFISVDLVRVNDTYFINTLGIGFDGQTNFIATTLPSCLSVFRYVLAGMLTLFRAKVFTAKIKSASLEDLIVTETKMIVLANGKWEGGKYLISPSSDPNDGILELIYANKVSTVRLVLEFLKLSAGVAVSEGMFSMIKGSNFSIKLSEPVYIHKDGEILEQASVFDIELIKKELQVIA